MTSQAEIVGSKTVVTNPLPELERGYEPYDHRTHDHQRARCHERIPPKPFHPSQIFPPRQPSEWREYNERLQADVSKAREIVDRVEPSCAFNVGGANYESVLNPYSQRYYDNVPNIDATVLTQPSVMQVPAAFLRKGGEYANAQFMDQHAQPNVYTGAGFAPGSFGDLDALPKDRLPVYFADNPSVTSRLLFPGIYDTLQYGQNEMHEKGRLVAQYQLGENYNDTLTQLTIPPSQCRLTKDDVLDILSDPRRSCTADMGLLTASLDYNNLDSSCLSRTEAVGGEVGGIAAAPAGIRAVVERTRESRDAFQMINTGCQDGMYEGLVDMQNNPLIFAADRARLALPMGQLYSGPITESMGDQMSTLADATEFYNPSWVQPRQFENQTRLRYSQLYP